LCNTTPGDTTPSVAARHLDLLEGRDPRVGLCLV
jgi:hypothetical protein